MTHDQIFEHFKKREEDREKQKEEKQLSSRVEMSGFVVFAEQQRRELKQKNPKMRVQEMMQLIKDKWEAMSEKNKDKCESSANKMKARIKQPSRFGWV